MPKKAKNEMSSLVTLIVAAGAFLALAYLYLTPGSVFLRFFIAVVVLIISGYMITNANGLKGAFGMYLLGGERGIGVVEGLAKRNKGFWNFFADWGISLSFGILAYFFFRKEIGIKPLILGIATVAFVIIFVSPYLPLILSFINMPGINTGVSSAPAQGVGPLFYPFFVISLIGGFSFYITLLLIYSGASLLYTLAIAALKFIASNPSGALSTLQTQIPGVTPVIPGITIPFFAGIISLIILLVVHEFSHGILSSLAKVKIKSIGIVLFGIIPMGAFVEPDERQITKLSVQKQNRIFIAGISANMVACLFFFVLTFAMLYYVLPNVNTGGVLVTFVVPNYPANGIIAVNSTILKWNNVTIRNSFDLATAEAAYVPSSKVALTTSRGVFAITPTSAGKLGIDTAPATMSAYYQAVEFIYAIVVLSFGLNFFVALFNLLPIPGFDGWRIYQNKIKSKKLLSALSLLIIAAIILNAIPWLWSVS